MTSTTGTLLKTFLDSGAPKNRTDYTTVVIIHGWGFHAGNIPGMLSAGTSLMDSPSSKLQEVIAPRAQVQRADRPA